MHLVVSSWAGLCVALSIILWQSFQLDGPAAVYPRVVIAGALLSAGVLLFTQVAGVTAAPQREAGAARDLRQFAKVALFVLIWAGYVLLLPWLGFMVATWLAIMASLAIARGRVSLVELLGAAAFVLVFTILINVVLYVPMPQGWLDEQLEILLYSYL